jgi:hypothetical protein
MPVALDMSASALLKQVADARSKLIPELNGLRLLAQAPVSGKLENAIQDRIKARMNRIALCEAVMSALEAANAAFEKLTSDGFPDMKDPPLSAETSAELDNQLATIEAGASALPQPTKTAAPARTAASAKKE